MTSGVIFEDELIYDFSDCFVEKRSFCKSKAEIKIILFSSELGTQSTQGYSVIEVNVPQMLWKDTKLQSSISH